MSIKNNTTSLQNLLNTVNSLPEAGGGGGSENTANITINAGAGWVLRYVDANGNNATTNVSAGGAATCRSGQLLIVTSEDINRIYDCSDGITYITNYQNNAASTAWIFHLAPESIGNKTINIYAK